MNATGQVVFEHQVEADEIAEHVLKFPLEFLAKGLYVVTWSYLNQRVSPRLLIE